MSGERESNRPPVLVRFAVGALAKSYEDVVSWTEHVRDDIAKLPEEIKKIPVNLASLPVQAVTDAVSSALRLQQNFNALVIKGDETLDLIFHKPEEKPDWATFDEDDEDDSAASGETGRTASVTPIAAPAADETPQQPGQAPGPAARTGRATTKPARTKPSAAKPSSSKPKTEKPATDKPAVPRLPAPPGASSGAPGGPELQEHRPELVDYLEYETLSLAQLRARARNLSLPELRELLSFERSHGNRPPFITLLENRITTSGA